MLRSNDISTWVGEICDQFDDRWQAGGNPRVEDVLPPEAEDRGALMVMLRELLAIDMEYRWKEYFKTDALSRRPWLEDYIQRFPVLRNSRSTVIQLLMSEFRARQVWGDRPSMATYQERFPKLGHSMTAKLHEVLGSLVASEVKVFSEGVLRFSAPVERPVLVGRQRKDEPSPVWMERDDDVERLVVAAANDRRMSRQHMRIELVAVNRLLVVNCSEVLDLEVEGTKVAPGNVQHVCPPASMSLGSYVVRFVTTSKVEGLDIFSVDVQSKNGNSANGECLP